MRSARLAVLIGALAAAAPVTSDATVVNDVTRLNPIVVERVVVPNTVEEVVAAVRSTPGPVSVGGGRFSQGGQTATEHTVQLDMRRLNGVVAFSKERREITVQAGITWRRLQEIIDPHGLSVQIMQSYANFTVGGSLSVNVHGRYVGQGPLVQSVRSIRIVLADGSLIQASPTQNGEVFYGAIGGYGGLGVIVEATLGLTDDVRVERRSEVMPVAAYRDFFDRSIRGHDDVVFHNGDLYPGAFDTIRATSYVRTDKPVTIEDRLMPYDRPYWVDRMVIRVVSEWPFGKALRQRVIDPLRLRGEQVEWRNYEASYDVKELEPVSRRSSTYVLQEYFIPVDRLEPFVTRIAEILNRYRVNVLNVSIRHATQDPGTLLAWARHEVFAFVLYYQQGTLAADRAEVGLWTRELVDAATSLDGAYYLPYQIHATEKQFHAAYPNADAFFALKLRLDPGNRFRNKLWDAYYKVAPDPERAPDLTPEPAPLPPIAPAAGKAVAEALRGMSDYRRDEAQTYLTLPEWILVYYPEEYGEFLRHHQASGFPYFGSIGQFWGYYREVSRITRGRNEFNWGYHAMIAVIGASYTLESGLKGTYEGTVGRLCEWLTGATPTQEDSFAADVAQEYVEFIRKEPWYEFSFLRSLKQLWAETDLLGPHLLRKWERKLALSAEYLVKAQYATIIRLGTKAAYGNADERVLALAWGATPEALAGEDHVEVRRRFDDGSALLALPRYDWFRGAVLDLVGRGVEFAEIAGNGEILLTAVVPSAWEYDLADGSLLFERPLLTDARRKRVAVRVPVRSLHRVLPQLAARSLQVEHLYDY